MPRFEALDLALSFVTALRPQLEPLGQRNNDLRSQLERAACSVPLNISEGARRTGKDRLHHYRIAAGSAAEARTALQVAAALGYLDPGPVAPVDQLLDRLLAILFRLTHPRVTPREA